MLPFDDYVVDFSVLDSCFYLEVVGKVISSMEPDSAIGDVDSLHGGLLSLDPLLDRILVDSLCQQQGWVRVYGEMDIHFQRCLVNQCTEMRGVIYVLALTSQILFQSCHNNSAVGWKKWDH